MDKYEYIYIFIEKHAAIFSFTCNAQQASQKNSNNTNKQSSENDPERKFPFQ